MEHYTLNLRIEICEDNGLTVSDTAQQVARDTLQTLKETIEGVFSHGQGTIQIDGTILKAEVRQEELSI